MRNDNHFDVCIMENLLILSSAIFWCICIAINKTDAHGMLLYPPMRGSMWRFYTKVPTNFNDNGLNCGHNFSSCGICGDPVNGPQRHSLYGTFGQFSKPRRLLVDRGMEMLTAFRITANHGGYVHYQVCNLDVYGQETEECFKPIPNSLHQISTKDGSSILVHHNIGRFTTRCNHCVLRLVWVTNSNWSQKNCQDKYTGCGEQEIFKNCADFSVV